MEPITAEEKRAQMVERRIEGKPAGMWGSLVLLTLFQILTGLQLIIAQGDKATTTIPPVSYTHLDVYKRQPRQKITAQRHIGLPVVLNPGARTFEFDMCIRQASLQAVSYTHLDVYKRQIHSHAGFLRSSRCG